MDEAEKQAAKAYETGVCHLCGIGIETPFEIIVGGEWYCSECANPIIAKLERERDVFEKKINVGKLDGTELAQVVSRSLNTYGFSEDIKLFVERMSNEHRTLQQTFTRLVVGWLQYLSTTSGFDGRNEGSVKFAKSIKEQLEKAYTPFI